MNGPKESAISFKIYITFFLEDGFQFSMEDRVYPITENDKEEDFSNVMLKKVIEYFDAKTLEYKKQDEIKFTLKVVNEKLDEIAKDKKNSEESGADSDEEPETKKAKTPFLVGKTKLSGTGRITPPRIT